MVGLLTLHALTNPPVPDHLELIRQSMERQDPDVVVVVGTGVSIGATGAPEASWFGLLQHGVDHLVSTDVITPTHADDLKGRLHDAFNPFSLDRALELAELVEQNLRVLDPESYTDWLRQAFADLTGRPERRATLDALRELADAGALLATTNYDNLLVDATGLPAVPWTDHDRLYRVVRATSLASFTSTGTGRVRTR